MIDTKALKEKILDLAMRGKLVEQDPIDEPVEQLLQKIKEEKEKLINEGKLKKEKARPKIEPKEIPYILPRNWQWVRLGEVLSLLNGDRGKNYPSQKYFQRTGIPIINAGALGKIEINNEKLNYISEEKFSMLKAGFVKKNDILYCIRGSLGKSSINTLDRGAIASSLVIIRPFAEMNIKYIYYILISKLGENQIKMEENGTAQPNLSADSLKKFLLPFPSLKEQNLIVQKIEEVFSKIDLLERSLEEVNYFANLVDRKVLEVAMQGKLVKQESTDEPASELIEKIKEKKGILVQEKKIKNEKKLLKIAKEEIPYTVPENWQWVRMNEIAYQISAGGDKPKIFSLTKDENYNVPIFSNGKNKQGLFGYAKEAKIFEKAITISARGTIGFSVVRTEPFVPIVRLLTIILLESNELFFKYYFDFAILAGEGSSIPQLTVPTLQAKVIPLPPLNEQNRIVTRIELLQSLTEKLRNK
ncbi:restriction endonuclease subunit S [Candidatus Enterococcus mansonii]|uniref:Type I restriction modification DNA specificity domain-containing protein n=2 Tax=Candidatus Enterococcus mansonii TaxID=1834181 RepID=A0ABU8IHY6_9ENTE